MEVKIYTAPDLDHSSIFKILLVDFEWSQIQTLAQNIENLPEPVNIMLFGENEKDWEWCMTAARSVDAILVNCDRKSSIELIKGFLLGFHNAEAFGRNDQAVFARSTQHDMAAWITKVLTNYPRKWNDR
mgnify:CR=1 FL=1